MSESNCAVHFYTAGQETNHPMDISIMFVDDNREFIRASIEAVSLINSGIQCSSAANAADAIHCIEQGVVRPNYIFVDLNMPKQNGKQFINALRQNPAFNDIKVILYSNIKLDDNKGAAAFLGSDFFITKPRLADDWQQNIREIIGPAAGI